MLVKFCTKMGLLQLIGKNIGGRVTQDKVVHKSFLKVGERGQKGLTYNKHLPEKSANFLQLF